MEATWYALIALMLTVYVVLDGFDFGAGILHLFIARTDEERRTVLAAIGPVWDGNEVWLIATGGVLVFAFPAAYATGFSGFYMPLMMVLWLLILRGLSIELRSHEQSPLWRAFWDGAFAFSSAVVAVVLGAALGNVIRGVPIDESGWFHGALFTDFAVGPRPGALDWFTVLIGVFALATMAGHGALYLWLKTEGPIAARCRRVARPLWLAIGLVAIVVTFAVARVQPAMVQMFVHRRWSWPLPLLSIAGLAMLSYGLWHARERLAFLGSITFIVGLLTSTAAASFPLLLRSTLSARYSIDVYSASSGHHGLAVGLAWWIPAMLLACGYFTYLFRSFRGKVRL